MVLIQSSRPGWVEGFGQVMGPCPSQNLDRDPQFELSLSLDNDEDASIGEVLQMQCI